MIDLQNEDDIPEYERPNKSQLKRESQALLDLAKNLVDLHEAKWVTLGLSAYLLEELLILKNTPQHGAKKRQLKRVAKLLREENVSIAKHIVEDAVKQHADVNMAFHKVEQWRDRLVAGDRQVLADFLGLYPSVNVQALNQLIRNAKQEAAKGGTSKSLKLLFKLLKDVIV
ncbi:MAG TPA: DUF615 domain-containing protein [Mariprofundaceae bacterium]|nr:DUF615 domain-containing protein [Mariprofundaceae bacterium]